MKRAVIVVLDGCGIGASPDAKKFNDQNANTLKHVIEKNPDIKLDNFEKLGLGNIIDIKGVKAVANPLGSFGKAKEVSVSKDSTSGHWEIAGLKVETPFPVFPNGFPEEIINKFIELNNLPGILLNKPYSGTEALKDFGEEHMKTKKPIVYTSADSVFQIACHEEVYPIEELHKMCEITRNKIFDGNPNIGRVIARPFLGNNKDDFYRTSNRKDFSVDPPNKTLLDIMKEKKFDVVGVGKIEDLFNFHGLTKSVHTGDNMAGVDQLLKDLKTTKEGLIFVNLVDFDSKWGHRLNHREFAKGLKQFDDRIPEILRSLSDDDIIIFTADHGCDPTTPGTDHTREYIPLLVFGNNLKSKDLKIRNTFSDIAATIAEYFDFEIENGESFLKIIQ